MKKELFKMKKGLLLMVMAAMTLTFTACGSSDSQEVEDVQVNEEVATEPALTGDEVTFTFKVTDPQGAEHEMEVMTLETTVGAALMEQGYIAGDDSEYGLMVNAVLGIYLDWDETGMYWAFYVDGDYANAGVDSTEIVEGQIYEFKAE